MTGVLSCGVAQLSSGRVHFRTFTGSEERPLLLLLHQSPLSSRRFQRLLPQLADLVQPVALDPPGYGESDPPAYEWEVADYSRMLFEFADWWGAQTFALFGRATGSVFAVDAAASRPDRVSALMVYGLPVYTEEEKRDRLASFAPPYQVDRDGGHLKWIWQRIQGEYPWAPPELLTELVHDYLSAGPDFATGYRSIWRYELRPALARLQVPTLLIGGGADRVAYMYERARACLPGAQTVVLDEATDFVAEQRPEEFAKVLRDFLAPIIGAA